MTETHDQGVALVTGAGRGIGRAIAYALADAGFLLLVNDLNDNADLAETVAGVEAHGSRAVALPADIADVAGHAELVERACRPFGTPTCLVNNAGISVARRDDMMKTTPESFDRLIGVNLRGPFFLTQAIASRMMEGKRPALPRSVITITSANAFMASPNRAEYCLSKSALSMMSKLFALRLADAGINVFEIRPGVIRTAMSAVARERYDALYAAGEFTPINRWGEASDVGRTAAALAGGAFAFSTGDTIHVDGGLHIARV